MGIVLLVNGVYNALQKPLKAASVNLIQMLVIYVPLAVVASKHFGINAVFLCLVFSYVLVSIAGHFLLNADIRKIEQSVLTN